MFKILGRQGRYTAQPYRHPPARGRLKSSMSQQLAYVIITPGPLSTSRGRAEFSAGSSLARDWILVAARMFAPGPELVQKYSEAIISTNDPQDRKIQELIRDYILKNLSPDGKTGRRRRVMMLLFKGEDAVRKVRSVVGNLGPDRRVGESIRDTYGDLIYDDNGTVRYFEPAVLGGANGRGSQRQAQTLG